MQLGFVGLGAMGLPMTRHLLEAGHQVTVASRSRGPVDRAVSLGAVDGARPGRGWPRPATWSSSACPVRRRWPRWWRPCCPSSDPGKVVVDCSTIDPEVDRAQHDRVAGHRCRLPRRPAVRGYRRRREGDADPDGRRGRAPTLEPVRPALDPFAGLIVHVGGPGMGQVVKLCNNLIYAAQMVATAEATALAVTSGVDIGQAPRGAAPHAPGTAWPCGPGSRWPACCRTARPPTAGGPAS